MTALIHLRDTTGEAGQRSEMLQKLSEAAQYLREVPPLLQSKLLIELARAYGWNGKSQEALHRIGEARATLPEENTFVPIFLSGDSDLFHLILLEGQTHLGMGDHLASSTTMKMQNLEQFCGYLEKGIHGAKALGSEKRRQEAIDIYWEARKIWPYEARVKELSDMFISMN